jgi:hypothetical protein
MRLKNNSSNEWLGYDCGHVSIDIRPNSVFEADEQAARIILRNLGCPQWVVRIGDAGKSSIPGIQGEPDNSEIPNNPRVRGCDICGSKAWKHKKGCPKLN